MDNPLTFTSKVLKFLLISIKMIFADKKAILKAVSGVLLLLYPYLHFWAADQVSLLPILINGFFLITPFIDYTFYIARHKHLYRDYLVQGFSAPEIIIGKSLTIFVCALLAMGLNLLLMFLLNKFSLIKVNLDPDLIIKTILFLPGIYGLILLEGVIQAFMGLIFLVRVINMLIFISNTYFFIQISDFVKASNNSLLLLANLAFPTGLIFLLFILKKEWLIDKRART